MIHYLLWLARLVGAQRGKTRTPYTSAWFAVLLRFAAHKHTRPPPRFRQGEENACEGEKVWELEMGEGKGKGKGWFFEQTGPDKASPTTTITTWSL